MAIEAEIKLLQNRLLAIKAKSDVSTTFAVTELPLGPHELADILRRLAAKKNLGERLCVGASKGGDRLAIHGDKEAVDWAVRIVKKLNEK